MGRGNPMDSVLDSVSDGHGFDTLCQIQNHRVHWVRRARKICGVQSPDDACVLRRRILLLGASSGVDLVT